MMKNLIQNNKGYTLLFAVLVSSLVLAIAISILTISKKEFLLATSARDSAAAFYAADAGIECAVYADYTNDAFNVSGANTGNTDCNFSPAPFFSVTSNPFEFHIKVGDVNDKSCAKVTVWKHNDSNGIPRTDIDSRGYNNGWSNNLCNTNSAKRVERAIHYGY